MRSEQQPDPWLPRASEYIDGDLSERECSEFERHVESCVECASAVREMREVSARAAALPGSVEPARDLWPGIRSRLAPRKARRLSWLAWPRRWPALEVAAACLLLLAAASVLWLSLPHGAPTPARPPAATGTEAFEDAGYDGTVTTLQQEVRRRLTLDPHLVEVVDENIATLDASIAVYRDALVRSPGDSELRNRLDAARRKKLALLQQAVSLSSEGLN